LLGGKGSKELVLLFEGLETTMAELGRGVDKLDLDLFGHPVAGSWEKRLAENNGSLLGSEDLTSDEEVVLVDFTVEGETAHRGDVLLDGVGISGGVVGYTSDGTSTETVDLLVDLGTGVVTLLTRAGDRPLDGSWMPSSDTSNLTETSVSLSAELLGTESLDDALVSLTLGDADGVDALVGLENFSNGDFLFEFAPSPVNLLGNSATVNLNFHNLGLVLSLLDLADLSGSEHTHNSAVLLDTGKVPLDRVLVLGVELVAVSVLGEGLLLSVHPVLVESALHIVVELGGPDSLESAEATGGFDVTDETDDLHGWALEDSASVHNILLDDLLAFTTFLVLDDVGHACLVANESSEMNGLRSIISGEGSYATTMVSCAALGDETEVTVSGLFVFTMGHSVY